ncbi:MAG: regulatory protein / Methylated-DNA--protein-cysteine methyltransferase [Myxococcaceae bacterium]|nr:regulatory protein / Methylated-DNA--protein-cysteine methyltransferase [Myxococcaceae bacterium]
MPQTALPKTFPETMPELDSDDARYEAVRQRDRRAEGRFFYAVASTGVYCRPGCPSRLPVRKNVSFHSSCDDAEQAGFRACKRCRPRELRPDAALHALLASMRAQLESESEHKTLAALAERAGMSPFYLQRLFKQHVGMTPRAYAAAHRLQRVERELRQGSSVTSALYEAGYSSSSRFYEAESGALGVSPAALRRGSPGLALRALVVPCSLGLVLVASTARGVCAITFGESRERMLDDLQQRFARAVIGESDDALASLTRQVVGMIDQARFSQDLPLDLIGTAFQQKVWRALRAIPRGETRSYGELAAQIGTPSAVRAVGTACGLNPVAALVPCHRVLRGDGKLGGYRWGLERKRQLLERERNE